MQCLQRRPSGVWVARLVVPVRLRLLVRRSEFIRSTGTTNQALAKIIAGETLTHWRRFLLEYDRMTDEELLNLVDGNAPLLLAAGHLPLGRAAAAAGLDPNAVLREAEAGQCDVFVRCRGVPGSVVSESVLRQWMGAHRLQNDIAAAAVDVAGDAGPLVIPGPDEMPNESMREEATGVLRICRMDVASVVNTLMAGEQAQLVVLAWNSSSSMLFIPDEAVVVSMGEIEVAAAAIEALRARLAAGVGHARVEAARLRQLTSVGGHVIRAGKHVQRRLSEALAAYVKHKLRADLSSEDEIKRVRNGCALLIDLDGDLLVGDVDAERLRLFREEKLSHVPAHENKVRLKFGTTTVAESIAAVVGAGWPVMSAGQRDLRMQWIRGWFRWLKAQGWIADDPGAALVGESVLTKAAKRAAPRDDEGREVFTPEHLIAIFSAPWFRAGLGAAPHHYWLPLLGAYTGARINELCQLHLDDIKAVEGGVWAINFNSGTGDKRLKNGPSARVVPIHPTLVHLGLGEWVKTLRASGYRRLFPELSYDDGKGYSKSAVKWFSSYLARLGYARDGKLTFHSFRHTFINALPRDTPARLGNQLSGHERGDDVRSRVYQKDVEPCDAMPFVERLSLQLPKIERFDAEAGSRAVQDALDRKLGGRKGKEDMGPLGAE